MSSASDARQTVEEALREHPEALVPARLEVAPTEGGWLVSGEGVELRVDGKTGALSGSAPVDALAARARLFALTCFAISAAWYGGRLFELAAILIAVPLRLLGGNRLIDPAVAAGLTLAGTLWLAVRYSRWVGTLRPELLDEPIATVAEGVARWPAPRGVDELLRRSALLMVPMVVYGLLTAWTAWESGAKAGTVLALLGLLPIVGIMLEAQRVPPMKVGQPEPPPRAGGSWNEFVTTALLGSRLALGVMLFGIGAKTSGLVDSLATLSATRVPMWSELLDTGLQLAVITAVLVGKPSHGRRAAALSLLAGLLGERLAGQPGKLVVTALTMFFTLRAAHRNTTGQALRLTMEFELLLALGRIGGRLMAGVFLGPLAVPLGEALGEQFTALSVSSRLEPVEVMPRAAPRVLAPARARLLALATLACAAFIVMGPWRTRGREAPRSWKPVAGAGWSAVMPGKPVRQSTVVQLPRFSVPAPLHHYTSVWKGSVFVVLELEWPKESVQLDSTGLLSLNELLPLQQLNMCEGLFIGVTRENSVRCLSSATPERLALGCVLSEPLGDQLADGELAFLANLKAGAQTFEGDKRGLQPGTCVIAPAMVRELQRKVDQLR